MTKTSFRFRSRLHGDLRLVRAEFDELMQLAYEGEILTRPVLPYEKYGDDSFVRAYRPIALAREGVLVHHIAASLMPGWNAPASRADARARREA